MSVKVLTVDDSKVVRIMVKRALKPYDCTIVEAGSGAAGLEAAAQEKPDLIFLDVTMPEMDGLEMLTRLRAEETLKSIPVIMLTAESAQENIARADALGISGYIPKPFKPDKLLEKIGLVLKLEAKSS